MLIEEAGPERMASAVVLGVAGADKVALEVLDEP